MVRIIIILILFISCFSLNGQIKTINVSGSATDIVLTQNKIHISTLSGRIESFDNNTFDKITSIIIKTYKDFDGKTVNSDIFHITNIGDSIYALVRAENGKSDIYQYINLKIKKIIDGNKFNSTIIDIAATKDGHLLFAMLSNELIYYNLETNRILYAKQINPYAFSCFALSTDQNSIIIADESGVISKVEIKSGNIITRYKGENVDNVLSVGWSEKLIIGGGKDRRVSFYNQFSGISWHQQNENFITIVAISPDSKTAVWFDDINNKIVVYSTDSKRIIQQLDGHKSLISSIIFISNDKMISCDEQGKVLIWNLKLT